MQQTVIGFFNNTSDAERAAERLRSSGFSDQEIDISTRHTDAYSSGRTTTGSMTDSQEQETPYNVSDESRYGNESRVGNSEEDRLRDRRDNDDDSFGDSIGRFFRNLFDSKDEAERYSSIGRKSCIVSVYAESSEQAERARDILDDSGAIDVDEQSSQYRTGSYTGDSERAADTDNQSRNTFNPEGVSDKSIPVIEENLNVGKREVERGGVRLRSRIVERPVEERLRLREEHVRVERVPVDRPATEADFDTFREGEIEVTETAEVPVVNKDARVVEEVRLSKDVDEREEVVRDTVRQTDVNVEKISDESLKKRSKKKS
jgi:stress response protein YsnF